MSAVPASGCYNKNNSNFMKNSSLHMANINKLLHNAKSEVLVNYIQSDPMGVTIIIKFTNGRLSFSLFYFSFYFLFCFIFLFSIFRTTRVRVDRSRRHISHNLMA